MNDSSTGFPLISELKKFPNRTQNAPIDTGITILSSIQSILKSLNKETEFQQYMKENKINFSEEAPWKR